VYTRPGRSAAARLPAAAACCVRFTVVITNQCFTHSNAQLTKALLNLMRCDFVSDVERCVHQEISSILCMRDIAGRSGLNIFCTR
jgi:hypothetical protein